MRQSAEQQWTDLTQCTMLGTATIGLFVIDVGEWLVALHRRLRSKSLEGQASLLCHIDDRYEPCHPVQLIISLFVMPTLLLHDSPKLLEQMELGETEDFAKSQAPWHELLFITRHATLPTVTGVNISSFEPCHLNDLPLTDAKGSSPPS